MTVKCQELKKCSTSRIPKCRRTLCSDVSVSAPLGSKMTGTQHIGRSHICRGKSPGIANEEAAPSKKTSPSSSKALQKKREDTLPLLRHIRPKPSPACSALPPREAPDGARSFPSCLHFPFLMVMVYVEKEEENPYIIQEKRMGKSTRRGPGR